MSGRDIRLRQWERHGSLYALDSVAAKSVLTLGPNGLRGATQVVSLSSNQGKYRVNNLDNRRYLHGLCSGMEIFL